MTNKENLRQEAHNIITRHTEHGHFDYEEARKDIDVIHDQPMTQEERTVFQEAFNWALSVVCHSLREEGV